MVIIVFGLPGSGKSFFATHLATRLGAQYLSSDHVRMKSLAHRCYSDREKQMIYHKMKVTMRKAVELKKDLVVDATFYKNDLRNSFIKELEGKVIYGLIEVTAPETVILERMKKPRKDSEADAPVYQKIKKQWEPFREQHLILDSTRPIEEMLTTAKAYLTETHDQARN